MAGVHRKEPIMVHITYFLGLKQEFQKYKALQNFFVCVSGIAKTE